MLSRSTTILPRFQARVVCRSVLAASLLALWVAAARAEDKRDAEEKEAGFQSMFNGKDFTGWRFSGGKEDGRRKRRTGRSRRV